VGKTPLHKMPLYHDSRKAIDRRVKGPDFEAIKPRWMSVEKTKRQIMQEKSEALSLMMNPPRDTTSGFNCLGHVSNSNTAIPFKKQIAREVRDTSPL
jgi:hypothetical protein